MRFPHTDKVRRPRAVALAATAVLVLGAVAGFALMGSDGEGATGSGFTFRGDFYSLSGAEVRSDRLGPVMDRDVPIMDTTTDVREVLGINPDIAVAARLTDVGGTAAEGGAAWLLMSPDPDVAADPWSYPDVADALNPG
ncbi:MAG: hypothetical protein AVDCRST_MAG32-1713 [uncultured Nocardioides sp.]|uniref:Uncharacterized protein n=1 Tax=uncultured Nocardioides sp. TaxID=198441 RepID=A0A6J4N9G4_9ACTN|nr:MAG: hypothetical protein AVDCRST_MAG32-1713 [uncultured Nocardioides sp.]